MTGLERMITISFIIESGILLVILGYIQEIYKLSNINAWYNKFNIKIEDNEDTDEDDE